jgi:VacB/RNase II family 3'-5' exoribonuclease
MSKKHHGKNSREADFKDSGRGRKGYDIEARAKLEMVANGFTPVFEAAVEQQVSQLEKLHQELKANAGIKDLRHLLWSSIDNVESKDLDQIEYSERLADGSIRLIVAIADVDSYVGKNSAIDKHAGANTTSVYTGVLTFPMLPEELSYDLTSLLPDQDRVAMCVDLTVNNRGEVTKSESYRALVRNKAKLDYISVGNWLDNGAHNADAPDKVAAVPGLIDQLKMQDEVKEQIHALRDSHGSLSLHTIEATTVAKDGDVLDLELVEPNPARDLIENCMIAANIATSKFLESNGLPSIRRIVKTPERWPRIVEVAETYGEYLPNEPDARALAAFLIKERAADPIHFPDLSLTIVKLLGRGEYVVKTPGKPVEGHFALAVNDYTHSTAPNRRYPDLVTQRLLKAALAGQKSPYDIDELTDVAINCTNKENDAKKVERTLRKVAACVLLSKKLGDEFDGIITGAKPDSTYVRLFRPPAEGRIIHGDKGLDVGDRVTVRLVAVNPENAFIDFELVEKVSGGPRKDRNRDRQDNDSDGRARKGQSHGRKHGHDHSHDQHGHDSRNHKR